MARIVRFGVSIEEDLLKGFDSLVQRKGFANRSEAIRNLIRGLLLEAEVSERPELPVVGTITLVYDHGHGDLTNRLVELQHQFHDRIISTLHVHVDRDNCLEVLVVRGPGEEVRRIADFLIGTRGVLQGRLTITGAETLRAGARHEHSHVHRHDHRPGGR